MQPLTYPLQRTKVQRPPLREQTLHRERLLEWLAAHIHGRVILVVAKAGYGKTTLLSDFSRRTRVRMLWYRIDEDDRDWAGFMRYLIAAGREADASFAPETARLLGQIEAGVTRAEVLDAFFHELPALAEVPTAIVFDDYHLAQEVPDIRSTVHDLVGRAPEGLSLVFLTRRSPQLPIARLRTLGEVAELSGDDLLFDRAETERLFRETYRRPLEPDVLADLHDRTEGWAASLEMVHAALRNRAQTDIRRFVHDLSGEQNELYEYFAEEVVADLDEDLQQFLMRTSLLQVVEPRFAAIALQTTEPAARELIAEAVRAGLLRAEGDLRADIYRYHPLLRTFLEARLRRIEGASVVDGLHTEIAQQAERSQSDWAVAAYHYAAAGRIEDLHRVLAVATPVIVSGGDFAAAEHYVGGYPPSNPSPWFDLLMSRLDLRAGRSVLARTRSADALTGFAGANTERANEGANLAMANLMAIALTTGDLDQCEEIALALRARQPDASLSAIAESTLALLSAAAEGDLEAARSTLLRAAILQQDPEHRHYFGITMLNLAYIDRARGAADATLEESAKAIAALQESSRGPELISARVVQGWALAHLGRWDDAEAEMRLALDDPNPLIRVEAISEAAEVHVYYGDLPTATSLLAAIPDPRDLAYRHWLLVSAACAIRAGEYDRANTLLEEMSSRRSFEPGGSTRFLVLRAQIALHGNHDDAAERLERAQTAAMHQRAGYWTRVLSVHQGSVGTGAEFRAAIASIGATDRAVLSVAAEAIAPRLGDLDRAGIEAVWAEAVLRPSRWREPLRRALEAQDEETRTRGADLLEEVGADEDVSRLRMFSRARRAKHRDPSIGRKLARRLASPVFVEDQGPVAIHVGRRVVQGSQIRRKVLSLLCFLLTRPDLAATRDQVLEALWPDLPPADAINSLNQTVYFLRRVFEVPFVDDLSPGYVQTVADLVQLDSELVDSRSRRCLALTKGLQRRLDTEMVTELSEQYRGRFALDFAYEEWAADYRDSMHARYLEIVERSIAADMASGHFDRAIGIARRAMDVDGDADNIELALVRLYRRTGSHSAAAEQYAHYASVLRRELGVDAPPLDSL